jgi:hypothetical protein
MFKGIDIIESVENKMWIEFALFYSIRLKLYKIYLFFELFGHNTKVSIHLLKCKTNILKK